MERKLISNTKSSELKSLLSKIEEVQGFHEPRRGLNNRITEADYKARIELIKIIPEFWLTAFLSNDTVSSMMSEHDREILKFMDSLLVNAYFPQNDSCKICYHITLGFKKNPYFEDSILVKLIGDSKDRSGTTIHWKEGAMKLIECSFVTWLTEAAHGMDEVALAIITKLWVDPLDDLNLALLDEAWMRHKASPSASGQRSDYTVVRSC